MDSLKVRFSVAGGASIGEGSGQAILRDLQAVCSNISNSKLLKVSVSLDNKTTFGGLQDEIQKAVDRGAAHVSAEKIKLKFGLDTKHLTELLNDFYKNYSIPENAGSGSRSGNRRGGSRRRSGGSGASQEQRENNNLMREALAIQKRLYDARKRLITVAGDGEEARELRAQIALREQEFNAIDAQIDQISDANEQERIRNQILEQQAELIRRNNLEQAKQNDKVSRRDFSASIKNAEQMMSSLGGALRIKNPAAYDRLLALLNELRNGTFSGSANDAAKALREINAEAIRSRANVEGFGQRLLGIFKDKYIYGLMAAIALEARRIFKYMYDAVVEIDTAMTELKKVTEETETTYDNFLSKAGTRAKELGASVADVVTATADFARLGHVLPDATQLADAAIVYKNVGDGITDISSASESIISTMQAFGVEVGAAMSIVDKFNEVGNNFAISSKGIGDALVRSASALAAAGNTLDESIALITAANEVVQNPDSVGTAMKSLSMYLRAAKTEAEAAGESTEGMADSTSELRDEILALTGQQVDIQLDENTFKSTVQIIRELSQVWDQLTDVSQANILELIGGKRNSNVVSALIENFETVEEVIESAANSSGSALKENEAVLDSINGKISILKASFEELSTEFMDSDIIKDIVGIITDLVEDLSFFEKSSTLLPWISFFGIIASNPFRDAAKSAGSFTGAISGLWSGAGVLGKIGLIVQAVSMLLSLIDMIPGVDLAGWFHNWTTPAAERVEELTSELESLEQEMSNLAEETSAFDKEASEAIDRFTELYAKNGENSLGIQVKLNDEEYQEFLALQNKIAEMFPQLDAGIDSNGNHILALSGNTDTLTASLWGMYEAEQALKNIEMLDKYDEAASEYDELKATRAKEIDNYIAERQYYFEQISAAWDLKRADPNFDINPLVGEYQSKIIELNAKIRSAQQSQSREMDVLSAFFPWLLTSNQDYRELDAVTQSILNRVVSSLDAEAAIEAAGGSDSTAITSYLYDQYVAPLVDLDLAGLREKYLAGELSSDQVIDSVASAIGDLNGDIKNEFISSMQEMGYEVKTFDDVINILANDITQIPDDTKIGITVDTSEFDEALERTKSEVEEVEDAVSNIEKDGFELVSSDDLETVIEKIPEMRLAYQAYIDAVANGIPVQKAWNDLLDKMKDGALAFKKVKAEEAIANVEKAATTYGKTSDEVQTAMHELAAICPEVADALYDAETGMFDLSGATGTSAEAIRDWIVLSLKNTVAQMSADLAILRAEFDSTANAAARSFIMMQIAGSTTVGGKQFTMDEDGNPELQGGGLKAFISSTSAEISAAEAKKAEAEALIKSFMNMDFSSYNKGGGGGSSKTPADEIKEGFDALSTSIEYCIQVQEQLFEKGKERLDSDAMRSALAREIGYYKEIKAVSEQALEAARNYYRSQGLSDAAIEQEDAIQDLKQASLDAAQDVENAMDRMVSAITEAFSSAVDDIQNVYSTLHSAADEYAASGFITIDTFQSIIALGVEYMSLLQDENGQLIINEENIKKVIAARTEQMAIESAMAYVEALRSAQMSGNVEELNNLLYATKEVTGASWGLVYASLALADLDETSYNAALNNIKALQSMAKTAINSIGQTENKVADSLKDMQTGLNDILEYVMDMIRDETDAQIEAIEDQKTAFAEYIEMRKEALDTAREETDYEEQKAELLKEISKLQSDIDMLDLVGTREAEAKKAELLKEQNDLQKELADLQNDYAYNAQIEALDKMNEAYVETKDDEIETLEKTISSEQKLYDLAIARIESQWDNLYQQLLDWNTEQGNSLNSEITESWNQAYAAAQKYGSYVSAMNGIQADIDAANSGVSNSLGPVDADTSYSDENAIHAIVWRMKRNSENWFDLSGTGKTTAADENKMLASQLAQYGINAVIGDDGVWYIDHIGGEQLYKKYHSGGVVGGGSIKQNEEYALLEKGENVFTEQTVAKLSGHFKVIGKLGDMFIHFADSLSSSLTSGINKLMKTQSGISQVVNDNADNRRIQVTIGDTYITGTNDETVSKHKEVTAGFMNDLARQLGVKW